jgi:hypothetical protein
MDQIGFQLTSATHNQTELNSSVPAECFANWSVPSRRGNDVRKDCAYRQLQ